MDDFQITEQAPELTAGADDVEPIDAEGAGERLSSRIADFLRTCWSRRKMICGILAAGILISVLYALSIPNFYTSTTSLMPPDTTSPYSNILGMLSPGGSAADVATEALGLGTPGELFIGILESRNVQDGVINRLDLTHYYQTSSMEDARKALKGSTRIATDQRSGLITISITCTDPVLAAKIAQAYVLELDRVVTDNTTSSARRERIFLEDRVKDVKQQLDDSAKQLSQFSTKSGALDISSQTKSMIEEGARLQAELVDGRSQLAALRETYSEDNSRVKALEAHNAVLQSQLDKMGGMPGGSEPAENSSDSLYPTADQLPALGLTYYDLERKMRVEEALWEALTKQYESAKVEEAAEIPTVHVLDAANVPEGKSGPSRRSIVEMGAMLSFAFACLVVLMGMVWEGMDPEGETKRLVGDAASYTLDSRRWFWRLPGMGWIHRRLTKSEATG
jgi:uncharacterized protein involved in exopolysaccharide biosynthesis